jgi:hypothetical protein
MRISPSYALIEINTDALCAFRKNRVKSMRISSQFGSHTLKFHVHGVHELIEIKVAPRLQAQS